VGIGRILLAGIGVVAVLPACAQYPVQTSTTSQNTPEMRAVGVLEWTGDEGHPKASRLIPITVYDGQDLQDAGIYLTQPAPLALSGEVEYELKENGKTVGLYDINNTGQEQGSWVGFGVWKPLPKPKPALRAAKSSIDNAWGDDVQSDQPVLHRKAHPDDSSGSGSGSSGKATDPDRPTLHKKDTSDSGGDSGSSGSENAPDPDRPTLHRSPDADSASGGAAPADPDRPKLKKSSDKVPADVGYVESMPDVTDPNRPHLLRGKPEDTGSQVLPTLMGLPPDMHQVVAVSDARNRPEHIWSFSWANPGDEAKMKTDMEEIARKALGLVPLAPPAAPPAAKRTAVTTHRKARPAPTPPPPAPLLDEQFRVFELSYGAGATMVFSVHTGGSGAQEKFVTLVAQPDLYGNVLVLRKNVTDAAHLDDTPRMRLVDAVDALADNRGELLFELRGATQRQFALYRVLRGQVDKLFVSGPGGIAPPPSGE
jgi:hypothetical protein